jgi:membrane protease YdiL (CAAX protease family)
MQKSNELKIKIFNFKLLKNRISRILIFFGFSFLLSQAFAQGIYSVTEDEVHEEFLEPKLLIKKEKPRGLFWAEFGSLLLPGLDQWIEHQHKSAIVYSGGAYMGLKLVFSSMSNLDQKGLTEDKDYFVNLSSRDDDLRNLMLGSHIYNVMGYMSAYHSFRTAVLSQQAYGKFAFLPPYETPKELLWAPFQFSHLTQWRVAVPLSVLLVALSGELKSDFLKHNSYNYKDQIYATSFSYGAGVGEEMVFRGWVMPMAYQAWGSELGANLFTSVTFAAGHITASNKAPTAQFLMGYYFGYLTMVNNWSLKEAIFLHTWWDILAFTATYLDASRTKEARIYLPLLGLSF